MAYIILKITCNLEHLLFTSETDNIFLIEDIEVGKVGMFL